LYIAPTTKSWSDTSSDSDEDVPWATTKEKYLKGLKHGKKRSKRNVAICYVESRGRSGFATKPFKPGDFVCEYVGSVRKLDDVNNDWGDVCNKQLNTGCYCLDVTLDGNRYVIDATNEPNHPGRCINHARKHPNLKLMQPVMLGEPPNNKLKVGFVARRAIGEGEELFYDYGISDPDLPWINCDAKEIGITLDKGSVMLNVD